MYAQIILDKSYLQVYCTYMKTTKRNFQAPSQSLRCEAHASTAVKGEGAQCMRARKIGCLCRQHAKLAEKGIK
jgi:hypothetical protein